MSSGRVARALFRNDLRVLRGEPVPFVILVAMPLILAVFMKNAFRGTDAGSGFRNASGAEQVTPGLATMFAFFIVANVGFTLFREYTWNTLDRTRTFGATASGVLLGKAGTPLLLGVVQQTVLFGAGYLLLGFRVEGPAWQLAVVAALLLVTVVAFGLALSAVSPSLQQVTAIANLVALVSAGISGALVPFASLDGWAQFIAPVTPAYWAMRAYRSIVFGGDTSQFVSSALVLAGFAVVFVVIAVWRFDLRDEKVSYA